MRSSITKSFRTEFDSLPRAIQLLAYKNYLLWRKQPSHPSLHFKPIGPYWSVRVGRTYRSLGREKDGCLYWFWIGHHKRYDELIKRS